MSANANSQPLSLRQEDGFLLLGVLFMVLLILLALAIAAPKMAESIRRDKEIETVHRGLQYARAIQVYFNKYGRYPNTIDQLMKTDNQRFLRKRYLDPMTGKDDWRIIHYGEATPQNIGLFGQTVQQNGITPTGATTGTGTGTGTGASSSSPFGGSSSPFGASGSSPGSGSPTLGSSGSGFGSSGSSFGSGSSTSPFSSSGSSSSPFGSSGSSTSPIGGTDSSTGSSYGSSTGIGGTSPTGGTNNLNTPQTTGGSSSAFGSPGVSVGGAPIVGVGLLSKKSSIKIYKKQDHYNKWEFVFDPNQNAMNAVASTGTTTGTGSGGYNNGSASGGFNNGSGSGGSSSGSGFGSSSGSGFGSSSGSGFGSSSGSGFGSSSGSGFGSSNGSGFGSSNGSGFGGSPTSPTSPTAPTTNSPQ
jgi:type II secretory pathway pseudopilin PulG